MAFFGGGESRLELGSGGGLVGLAVASGCRLRDSSPMIITDQDEMFSLMEHNIALNNLGDKVQPLILNWWVEQLRAYS